MSYYIIDKDGVLIATVSPAQSFLNGCVVPQNTGQSAVHAAKHKGIQQLKPWEQQRVKFSFRCVFPLVATFIIASAPADSQVPSSTALTYADVARLSLTAPVAAHVRLKRAVRLKPEEAGQPAPGHSRFYMVAEVITLIRGPQMPSEVSYLADVPNTPHGKPAKLSKKSEHLLLASPVPDRPGELRLAGANALLPYSAAMLEQLRSIIREATAPGAAPVVTGVGKTFHMPGALSGESETQIFLLTSDGRPVSLNVLRRPGQTPQWAVALGEIVDDAAGPPPPNSLLWYRLACSLPPALPQASLSEMEPDFVPAVQADYRLVLEGLGACARTLR